MLKESDFNKEQQKAEARKRRSELSAVKNKKNDTTTNRAAVLKDGSQYEICIDEARKEFIVIEGKKLLYPKSVKDFDYEKDISGMRMRVNTFIKDKWDTLIIRFNRSTWEEFGDRTFVMDEDEDGFDIELFEPISLNNKAFRITYHKRDIIFHSKLIDCLENVWYKIERVGENKFRVNVR